METVKVATFNINGISKRAKAGMFEYFLYRQDLDILLVQEVTSLETMNVPGYVTNLNIGNTMPGTAFVARSKINLTNITALSPGRALSLISEVYG